MEDKGQRQNFQKFYDSVDMPGGYKFNHVETLKTVDLYYNSKYKSGQYDRQGYRKFFYNIVKPACDIATKFVDLDTKDITLIPLSADDNNELFVWLMQKKLKVWLQENDFACLLNEIGENYPKYGTVVVKKTDDGLKLVNIQNLRMDPTTECLEDSPFVYEIIPMTRQEVASMKGWDTAELFSRGDDQILEIYDMYDRTVDGWHRTVKGDLFTTKKGNGINRNVESEINTRNSFVGSVTLFEEDIIENENEDTCPFPYRELHWERVPGRWLGRGFVEYLEENQVAMNETENLERKGLIYTSLKLYQTRDEGIGGSNILSAAENGDILRVTSEITPIAVEERNLGAFRATRENWNFNTERKTFTTDITTGSSLPSRTPLGVANLQASFAASYFELKRENFGLFVKELITDDIIPDFLSANNKEHILTFSNSESEIDYLHQAITKIKLDIAMADYANRTGFFPTENQIEVLKTQILTSLNDQKYKFLQVPKDAYKNLEYKLEVNITGESIDNGTKAQVLQLALQIIGTNPGVLSDPVTRKVFFSLLSLGGISEVELGALQNTTPGPQMLPQYESFRKVAGSMSAPAPVGGIMSNIQQVP